MNTVAFTSEFVCENLARKVVLGLEAMADDNARTFAHGLIIPIAQRLSSGKMARGALKAMLSRTHALLESAPNVVSVTFGEATRKKLSSSEQYHLTYVLASTVTDDWVGFISTEMSVSRKSMMVCSTNTDFRIHRHALARYMNRAMRPTDDMLGGIEDAMRAATLLGHAVTETETGNIAIPMQDGMLFGRVKLINNATSPSYRTRFAFKNHQPEMTEEARDTLHDRYRVVVEIMTYVDWNSLSMPRIDLHKAISKVMSEHQFGMRQCFNLAYHEQAMMEQEEMDGVFPAITAALEASRALVKSAEWQQYEARG
jgi:hypothetical protein